MIFSLKSDTGQVPKYHIPRIFWVDTKVVVVDCIHSAANTTSFGYVPNVLKKIKTHALKIQIMKTTESQRSNLRSYWTLPVLIVFHSEQTLAIPLWHTQASEHIIIAITSQ